ncbi:MAG: fructose-6-phosphate aldolase [Erysipelotrichaceae bacterium]|nr:fructose-6-phosphate aldolase [Erysipelotrichaceae bacterium]
MKLLIDDANIEEIRRLMDLYPISGGSTNPSILAKYGNDPWNLLKQIRSLYGDHRDMHVQTIATDAQGMIDDGHRIAEELGKNTLIKIPCIPEGFKAMKALAKEGYRVTGTAVYTPLQAYLAFESGAEYVAPYVDRIDNMGFDGVQVVKTIQDIIDNNGYPCKIMAASFKNSQQVLELCAYGIDSATCGPAIIDNFTNNAAIQTAVDKFTADFEKAVGKGKTMANL